MRKHALPRGLALELGVGVAKQAGPDAQLLAELIGVRAAAGLGRGHDLGLIHRPQGLALGGGLLLGLGPGLLGRHLGRGQLLLVLQSVVPGVQVLGARDELVVAIGHDDRAQEREEGHQDQNDQRHHGHGIFAEPSSRVLPEGHALPVLDKIFLLLRGGGCKVGVGQLAPGDHILHIELEGAEFGLFHFVCHAQLSFPRVMRGSTTL